ncbi:MAG TPA: acyl-CoA dehydrogenase [Chloroflexi bacterium]|nr:acyl-CoA dehydrogenase [Chloroflexota bacterium]HHW85568.1 acyl-CoA dehydrogenase [Chloroflexota bacterium]
MNRTLYTDEHLRFRDAFQRFLEKEILPFHQQWEHDGIVPREVWRKAGALGFLCFEAPEVLGGLAERDYRYHAVIAEALSYYGATGIGFGLHSSIVLPYILHYGTSAQQQRWIPRMVTGEWIGAIAMTEPAAGSDLAGIRTTAIRRGDYYVVNGQKTFITNGINSDLVITVVKTDPTQRHKGVSLLVIERGMAGFTRGRNLDKIGLKAQDTAELFFDNVRVPVDNLLGEEGKGFYYLMQRLPQERLDIAVTAVAACEAALDMTLRYCKERTAFGQPIGAFQNTRFKLAEMKTEVQVARVFVDRCIEALNAGELTAEEAAMAKWWTTDLQKRVMDECLQLHGGYGYMLEYPIAKYYLDARVQAIYGGTNEIMKEVIGRGMGL